MNRITIIAFFMTVSLYVNGQSKSDFEGRWNIKGYIYMGMTFSPEEDEKDDYLHFLGNGTFSSREGTTIETGKWEWQADKGSILMSQWGESLALEVIRVSDSELIFEIEEDGDSIRVRYSKASAKGQTGNNK